MHKTIKLYHFIVDCKLIVIHLQVKNQTSSIDEMLKSSVCKKATVPHMKKTIYDPSCLVYCADLCGVRCKNLCNKTHNECSRGKLTESFLYCPSSAAAKQTINLGFVTYETKDVETFGKGAQYKRVEKILADKSDEEFKTLLTKEFNGYAEHTLSYWFLRATKLEAFAPSETRSTTATITSDFGEAIQIVAKKEVSDQFYHRPEVCNLN